MKILISKHAQARMKTYGLDREIILDAVRHPEEVLKGYGGRSIAHKSLDHFILRVVYERYGERIIVITVYPAEKGRYWRG